MKYLFFLMLLVTIHPLFAQQSKINITGTVVDKTSQQPIEFVTVVLLDKKDSSTLKGTITDKKGKFMIGEVLPGDYLIRYSYIGYADIVAQDLRITGQQQRVNLGTIPISQ
jgi:Predicted outer membrane protein